MPDNLIRLADDLDEGVSEETPELILDIELDPPIVFQKKPFSSLHLEEPTGGMLEAALQETISGQNAYTLWRFEVTLIAKVAKVPREVVLMMRESQIQEASRFLLRVRGGGPQTGATS